jgi:hypothetical protein
MLSCQALSGVRLDALLLLLLHCSFVSNLDTRLVRVFARLPHCQLSVRPSVFGAIVTAPLGYDSTEAEQRK